MFWWTSTKMLVSFLGLVTFWAFLLKRSTFRQPLNTQPFLFSTSGAKRSTEGSYTCDKGLSRSRLKGWTLLYVQFVTRLLFLSFSSCLPSVHPFSSLSWAEICPCITTCSQRKPSVQKQIQFLTSAQSPLINCKTVFFFPCIWELKVLNQGWGCERVFKGLDWGWCKGN